MTNFMAVHGDRLIDNGYRILPIWPGTKKPGKVEAGAWREYAGWEKHATRDTKAFELGIWRRWEGCGIGVACGNVIGVDIDIITDDGVAVRVQELAHQMLGVTPAIRVGQWPKTMLVYRSKAPFRSIKRHPIEILGEGAQFVAYAIHPTTGQPYQWIDEGLADLHISQLPEVTEEQVRRFLDAAINILPDDMRKKREAPAMAGPHGLSELGAKASIEAVRAAVEWIPNPDHDWDEWSRIGMAIHAAREGGEDGFEVFDAWSQKSRKYDAAACRERWDHWHRSPANSLGFGLLNHLAVEAGWIPDADISFGEDGPPIEVGEAAAEALIAKAREAKAVAPAVATTDYRVPPALMDLDGALKLFVDWCTATAPRPQPFLALASALPMFGALTGRRYRTPTNLRGNVYTVAIADSGGGKDHGRKCALTALHMAGLADYAGGDDLGSGSAILSALQRHPAQMFRSDEFGKHLQTWTDKRAPAHKRDIWTKLTILYSSADGVVQGTEYADQKTRPRADIIQPCATFLGTTVPAPFWKALEEGAIADGSLARFLVFRTDMDYPPLRHDPPADDPPEALLDAMRAIAAGVDNGEGNLGSIMDAGTTPKPYTVPFGKGAGELFRRYAEEQDDWLRQAAGSPFTALVGRLRENAMKLAMIRAVCRAPADPVVTERDARWAWTLAQHCLDTVLRDADRYLADNETEAKHKRVLAIITRAGIEGISKSQLTRSTQFLTTRERNEIVASLAESGQIVVREIPTRTRKGYHFYAAGLGAEYFNTTTVGSPEDRPVTH